VRQKPVSPRSQFLQNPQAILNWQIYPVANLDTFNSGPNLNDLTEILVPEDLSLFNGGAALYTCRSEPQMFVIVIFTSAPVGFSIFGSGTFCICTTSGPS
jgi:hypothetical protein